VGRDPVLAGARRILDEGCGVGVIGLCAAKAFPEAEVVLRDRDSLAVAFTERNRLLNKLKGVTAWKDPETGTERQARPAPRVEWGLLGDGREGGPYDFVLSNLPAKAGAPVLASFFARLSGHQGGSLGGRLGGEALLAPGGRAAVVIVKPLAEAAAAWIAEAGLAVVARERGTGHEVYVVEKASCAAVSDAAVSGAAPEDSGAAAGDDALAAYRRGQARFKLADLVYGAAGFWGLPEFDTPGYGSAVSAETLSRAFSERRSLADALVIEPGAGHAAIWIARKLAPSRLVAASRDALSLEATCRNLASLPERSRPAYAVLDALGVDGEAPASFDLVVENPVIVPERDWTAASWERAGRILRPGGVYLACCSPTEAARLEKRRPSDGRVRWSLLCRRRKKGFVALAWLRS
jgi:SAM-dependent methyltransferase